MHIRPGLSIFRLPSGRRVCVCVSSFALVAFIAGERWAVGILEVTAQRRHFKFVVICNLDADCTYLREDDHHSFPFGRRCT